MIDADGLYECPISPQSHIPVGVMTAARAVSFFQASHGVSPISVSFSKSLLESQFPHRHHYMFSTGVNSGERSSDGISALLFGT